jgi:hypothetical protein
VHSLDERPSEQRLVQHKTDDPAQYFFSDALSMNFVDHEYTLSRKALSDYLFLAGISGLVKIATVPMGRDKIMVRISNMADLFDSEEKEPLKHKVT